MVNEGNQMDFRILKINHNEKGEIISLKKLRETESADCLHYWLNPLDTFLLAVNEDEFVSALKFQYQLEQKTDNIIRIINPASSAAFAKSFYSYDDMKIHFDVHYASWRCQCEYEDEICEIIDLTKSRKHKNDIDASDIDVMKGGLLISRIISGNIQDVLLHDVMEYDLKMIITKKGVIRDVISLIDSSTAIPTHKSVKLPYDLICNANLSLLLGDKKLDFDFNQLLAIVPNEGIVGVEAEIPVGKDISITIQEGNNKSKYSLGGLLLNN